MNQSGLINQASPTHGPRLRPGFFIGRQVRKNCGYVWGLTDNWTMSLRPHPIETLLSALAGWLPLLGGLTLLAITLLTPEWLGWRELVWQRDMLRLQAESLETQRDRYAMFHEALQADDPVLLERLAYTQLRYKPAGKALMGDFRLTGGSVEAGGVQTGTVGTGSFGSTEVVEAWLAQPQPVVGKDIQPLRPINTRMTRLTRGPSRYVLLLVAGICLMAGFWPESDEDDRDDDLIGQDTDDPLDNFADSAGWTGGPLRLVPGFGPGLRLFRKGA